MTAETQTSPSPEQDASSINHAASVGKELTFGDRMRASRAAEQEARETAANVPGRTIIRPEDYDSSAPLSESLRADIAENNDIMPYPMIIPSAPLTERQETIRAALTAPLDGIVPGPRPSESRDTDPLPPVKVVRPGDVDLNQPLSEQLKAGIGRPEDINPNQISPDKPVISSKWDKHPAQVEAEQRVAAAREQAARRDESAPRAYDL